jgi:hypothetical protein
MVARAASTARRRWPFLLIGALTLSSVLFAGLWLGAASAGSSQASAQFSNVKMNKFDAIDGGGGACASGGYNWGDIPGASKTFNLAGTATRPVLVTVSLQANFQSLSTGNGYVRLLIDGGQQGVGNLTWIDDASNTSVGSTTFSPLSYTFLTLALAPGSHTAKIQFQSSDANLFCVQHWTMAVLHS